jgi:hypothetical protein
LSDSNCINGNSIPENTKGSENNWKPFDNDRYSKQKLVERLGRDYHYCWNLHRFKSMHIGATNNDGAIWHRFYCLEYALECLESLSVYSKEEDACILPSYWIIFPTVYDDWYFIISVDTKSGIYLEMQDIIRKHGGLIGFYTTELIKEFRVEMI